MKKSCMREGCGNAAEIVPKLRVPAAGWPMKFHTPCEVIIGIESCAEHFKEMSAQELLTDDLRVMFGHMLRGLGKAKADFDRATIEPISMKGSEYRKFVAERKPDA